MILNMTVFRIIALLTFIGGSLLIWDASDRSGSAHEKQVALGNEDGPYVFIENDRLISKSINEGKVTSTRLDNKTFETVYPPKADSYSNVSRIAALSDIHGQYQLAVRLLKNNGIINDRLEWSFGEGHLVIVGDIFDRGDQVNEMLWLVYELEKQAIRAGGNVHFLLGNHEFMVLHGNNKYVNNKYLRTAKLMGMDHKELYGPNTILGRWLRSKATIVRINEDVYVHGGISKAFLSQVDFKLVDINKKMRGSIERSKVEMKSTGFYDIYYGSDGPIWYRGYFKDNLANSEISHILKQVGSEHIIVGHCSNETVVGMFDNRIIGVDSSIKKGKYGELLMIENGNYSRRTLRGKRKKMD